MNWSQRHQNVVWPPFTQVQTADQSLVITKAKDALLFDEDGNSYIDCNSSWWVNVHGHGHPHIQQAIHRQFGELDHVLLAGVTHPKVIELSERIIALLPEHFSKVFFSDNGSTAVEVALKMSMQYWHNKGIKKTRVLAMDGAYHGDTFGAMSVGQRGYFFEPFEHLFFDADYLPFPTSKNEHEIIQKARQFFESGEFAAIILEPLVQGSAGMQMYSASILDQLIKLAHENDVLVIFDEVMTGWGRTGKLFAMDHCTLKPDIVCLSKGLTGGVLPLGLTVASEKIFQAFLDDATTKALLHGHSFTGNALACAAACASLDIFEQPATSTHIERISMRHQNFRKKIEQNFKDKLHVRQTGTILAIEFPSSEGYFSDLKQRAMRHFIGHGMYLRPLGNVIFLNPPYCILDEQLEHCYKTLEQFIHTELE
jgi:adenosylmethionine---8-amino-7-oxononanoate aminotransferase